MKTGRHLLSWRHRRNLPRAVMLGLFSALVGCGELPGGVSAVQGMGSFNIAPHPQTLQIVKSAGQVLTTPTVRIVTFSSDADNSPLSTFGGKLAGSTYWAATTQEYGVGTLTAGAPLQETFTWPASTTDGDLGSGEKSDIETYLESQLDVATPPWGAPSNSTIYALFMPAGIKVSPDGGQIPDACAANILGWHTALLLPKSQVAVPYVVVPDCGARGSLSELDSRTLVMSHEIIETATDPFLNAYSAVDANHVAWQVAAGAAEVGAACGAAVDANQLAIKPADLGFVVQRTWSDQAALASHSPCVPAPSTPFFNAVPVLSAPIMAAVSSNAAVPPLPTTGIQVTAGQTGTVAVQLYSDGAVSAWTVTATEVGTSALQLTLDKTSGNNGDTLNLSIAVTGTAPASQQELVQISSTLGGQTNNEYLVVHN